MKKSILIPAAVIIILSCGTTKTIQVIEDNRLPVMDISKKVKEYLENGENIEARNSNDRTALVLACERGQVEVVKVLIKKGADVNVKWSGEPVATRTILWGGSSVDEKYAILKLLISAGADLNARDVYNRIPLHWAALTCTDEKISRLLADSGSKTDSRDEKGQTPYDIALRKNCRAALNVLKK